MTELSRLLLSAALVLLAIHFAHAAGITKRHEDKPTPHEHHKDCDHETKRKLGSKHKITGPRAHHHTEVSNGETTTNYVQYKIRNRWKLKQNESTKDFWHTNESISLDSYSFEPMEWSDNRVPPTLRPMEEHVKMWKTIMQEITYKDTSDPEITLDPNLSHPRYYQCLYCFSKFDEDTKLDHHYRTKHADQWLISTTTEAIYQCALCLKKFNQSTFRHHQQSVHNMTVERYKFERPPEMTYSSFDTREANKIFDDRFGGSDEYNFYTYPKNNTFFMTMYDFDSNNSEIITNHYIDPWPNDANV